MLANNVQGWLRFAPLPLMVGTIAAMAYASWLYRRWRSKAVVDAGNVLGFRRDPDNVVDIPEMHLFADKGTLAAYSNVLKGRCASYDTIIFDYSYVTGGGKTTRGVNQTVAAFHLPGANMPDFQIMPRSLAGAVSHLFSTNHLKFDPNSAFGKKYIVSGADPESTASLFTPGVVDFFGGTEVDHLTVEGYWDWIIVYRPEHRVKPSDLGRFLDVATRIASGMLEQVPRPLLPK